MGIFAVPLLVLFAAAAATPLSSPKQSKTFTIHQTNAGVTHNAYGPVAMMRAMAKYKVPVPDNVRSAALAAVSSGSIAAYPERYDFDYLSPVTVGASTLNISFDSGSSDFWVFSTLMPASQRSGHTVYTPRGSAQAGETWSTTYSDHSGANGVVYSDSVVVGGVTVTSQAVEAATSASSDFSGNLYLNGLVGLGYPSLNQCSPNKCKTFLQNAASVLASNLFTAALKKARTGSYDFGFIDSSKYNGSITYTPVDTDYGYWLFQVTGYKIGNTAYTSTLDSIMDTGTTLIFLPDAVVNNYYAQVPGAQKSASVGGWIFPCTATLPPFSLVIGGTTFVVPATYMTYCPVDSTRSTCYGSLQSSNGFGVNIIGGVFMKTQFVVFDIANSRLGIATPSVL